MAFWVAVVLLLVPALGLTFARVVEPHVSFWLLVEGVAPLAIPLYAGAVLLLGVRLLLVRRWWTWGAAGVAVAGLVAHCWWFAPQVIGSNPPAADGAQTIVVMTANVSGGEADSVEVVRHASDAGVDLLVVEEITDADVADMERAGLDDLLPYRAGATAGSGDGTMVFSNTPLGTAVPVNTMHDSWLVPRGDLTVLAVHPYAPTVPDAWRDDLATVVRTTADASPDLVVGDFNATADHAPMRALRDAGYRDVGELANQGWQPTWPSDGQVTVLGVALPSVAQIDHVLVGPGLAALGMRRVVIPGTDHRAVIAEVARK